MRCTHWTKRILCLLVACMLAMTLGACAREELAELVLIEEEQVPLTNGVTNVRTPSTGSSTVSGRGATIDHSNTNQGYVMAKYSGSASKIKVQIARSGGTTYTYNLNTGGSWEVFPLTAGNGSYTVNVYENVSGSQYALAVGTNITVSLASSTLPFLYPSQYVNFNSGSTTVSTGASLTRTASTDLAVVENVYNYVINNISYDTAKANQVQAGQLTGYLPVVDSVLSAGKGICFDYAAVMAAMLRSQNVPTKLEVGYVSGGAYHAWISVYITDVGWVNDAIYFDGASWKLMDPTFASSGNQSSDIMRFIGNGSNYSTVYTY